MAAGVVMLKYIKSKDNLADTLTKAVSGDLHYKLWKPYLLNPLMEIGEYQHMKINCEDIYSDV